MNITQCPRCSKFLPAMAVYCRRCGFPVRVPRKLIDMMAWALLAGLLTVAMGAWLLSLSG
jgi:uncharacterized paraquat-inducible protein A